MNTTEKVFVYFTNLDQQTVFYNELAERGYRWMSGQIVDDPPVFLRYPFADTKERICVRTVDVDHKKIGYTPMEVFSEKERESIMAKTLPYDQFIEKYLKEKSK